MQQELSSLSTQAVLSRLPEFQLSYETITHKKEYPNYNIGLAIPSGKKYYTYYSFHGEDDVCYLMEIRENKNDIYHKKISKISILYKDAPHELCLGTLLYGTFLEQEQGAKSFFVVEDIVMYKGIVLGNIPFSHKIGYMNGLFQYIQNDTNSGVLFALPYMWNIERPEEASVIAEYEKEKNNLYYTTHHIQLRKWGEISPHLNIPLNKVGSKPNIDITTSGGIEKCTESREKSEKHNISYIPVSMNFNKPQYKYSCVFNVCADIQYDVYHLYACGKNNELVYYNVAGIPTLKTSVFMNGLFRKIRENANIDFIEESDDEEDNETSASTCAEDKYVDLNKNIIMECVFHYKFKKWIPTRVLPAGSRIVHISKL